MEKRNITTVQDNGLGLRDIIFISVLLAAGAVLKFFAGSMFTVVKPNFIIAMYCLAMLIIRPGLKESVIIGLLSGIICQLFPGTPYVNIVSEMVGAVCMFFLIKIPMNVGKFSLSPIITTFISTLASGFTFILIVYLALYSGADVSPMPLKLFCGIIFGTAAINSIIVQILYIPLKLAIKKH